MGQPCRNLQEQKATAKSVFFFRFGISDVDDLSMHVGIDTGFDADINRDNDRNLAVSYWSNWNVPD